MTISSGTYVKDEDWEKLTETTLVLKKFTPMTMIRDGQVKDPPDNSPYGALDFSIGNNPTENKGYILHEIDFKNLWFIHLDLGVKKNEMVIFKWINRKESINKSLSDEYSRFVFYIFTTDSYNLLLNPGLRPDLKGEAYKNATKPLLTLGETK